MTGGTLRMGDSGQVASIIHEWFNGKRGELTGVEVGVHRGETSAVLLRSFPRLHLFMVDPWDTYPSNHPYYRSGDGCSRLTQAEQMANLRAAKVGTDFALERRTIIPKTSLEAAKQFSGLADRLEGKFDGRFDFVFIDGDHTFDAVRADIAAWWPLVNDGGLLCGHDIDHPRDVRGIWGVRRAVEEHAAATGLAFEVSGSCWWFAKLTGVNS